MIFRRTWLAILMALAIAAVVVVAVPALRENSLRMIGWALVVDEPLTPADVIVISIESAGAGSLEAADLVESGIAKRVAVFQDPPTGYDYEFIRRGLPYGDWGAMQTRQLNLLGIQDVMQIPREASGTSRVGELLQAWCRMHLIQSLVLVVARDHSRRFRRVIDRTMKGSQIKVTIRPARYSSFDPDRWWQSRGGIRIAIVEMQKLALDFILHPMSSWN